jgi:hypothetical protein
MKKLVTPRLQKFVELDHARLANTTGGHNPTGQAKDTQFVIQSPRTNFV